MRDGESVGFESKSDLFCLAQVGWVQNAEKLEFNYEE